MENLAILALMGLSLVGGYLIRTGQESIERNLIESLPELEYYDDEDECYYFIDD